MTFLCEKHSQIILQFEVDIKLLDLTSTLTVGPGTTGADLHKTIPAGYFFLNLKKNLSALKANSQQSTRKFLTGKLPQTKTKQKKKKKFSSQKLARNNVLRGF